MDNKTNSGREIHHEVTYHHEGDGESRVTTPRCTCGWVGHPVYGYEDAPLMNMLQQKTEHLLKINPKSTEGDPHGSNWIRRG